MDFPDCIRCDTPILAVDDGLCKKCRRAFTAEGQRSMAERRRKRLATRSGDLGPMRYLTDVDGRARAERWFSVHLVDLMAISQTPQLRNRCAKYGLSVGEWMVRVADQKSRCGICSKEMPALALFIDHDHVTNKVRGLLCCSCNTGLGMLRIDGDAAAERANAVVGYLRRFYAAPRNKLRTP